MKGHSSRQAGFTLFETLIATSIISIVSLASVYMLFLSLSLRDMTSSTAKTEESTRVLDRSLRQAIAGAQAITGSGTELFLRSEAECWSFVYDGNIKNLKYAKISQTGCSADPNPTDLFFPESTTVNNMSFTYGPLATGGRHVRITTELETVLPFDSYVSTFSNSYVNLVD